MSILYNIHPLSNKRIQNGIANVDATGSCSLMSMRLLSDGYKQPNNMPNTIVQRYNR